MLKEEYEVSLVFIQTGLERINGLNHKGLTLYALFNLRLSCEYYFVKQANQAKSGLIKSIYNYASKAAKAIGRVNAWFIFPRPKCYSLWPDNLTWFYPKAYRKLVELHKSNRLDSIFTINSPFPAHLAGRKFKQNFPDVKWITYTVDPYSRAADFTKTLIFSKLKAKIDIIEEKSIYQLADHNFVSEEVFDTDATLINLAINKTEPIPYLLVSARAASDSWNFPSDKINLVYAGRFYNKIRNPEYLLKTFLAIDNPNLLLHLFTKSDCDNLIDFYINRSNGRIIRQAQVTIDQLPEILIKADILISVGNSISAFKPSKILEYIGTGRPIIHFYQNKLQDEILLKYRLALQINQSLEDIDQNAQLVKDFCLKMRGSSILFPELSNNFPQHTFIQIRSLLINGINKH